MAHAYDKGNDKWMCTKGTEPIWMNKENNGSIQQEIEIKKFKLYITHAYTNLS